MSKIVLLAVLFVLTASGAVDAQQRDYAIAVHIQDYYMDCQTHLGDCWAIDTWRLEAGMEVHIYVMVCGHGWGPGSDGFTAAWYGLDWPTDWTFISWVSCADWAVGTIGLPGDHVEQHWNQCVPPSGWPVTVGILTLVPTSPGQVKVIIHSGIGFARVDDCHGTFETILPCNIGNGRAGWVSIGIREPGCNPCPCVGSPCYLLPSGNEPGTWGMIKTLYR